MATAFRTAAMATALSVIPAASYAGVFVSIGFGAPPVLPVYVQPACPAPGYIWTPGYWAYDEEGGYYWVPGAWVLAPYTGALWTPGYWGWGGGGYLWHAGYWGPHVGFYGGVNYGFGYTGIGFAGGYWNHGVFAYNRSVTNVNIVNVHNTYNQTVINRNMSRVSYNGGQGGIQARPTAAEQRFSQEPHMAPIGAQQQNMMRASQNRAQFASVNRGQPSNLARMQPATFNRAVSTPNSTMNRGSAAMQSRSHFADNASRPTFNNAPRPTQASQNFNRGPQQTYRPPQQGYNANRGQPLYRAAPQQFHSQESHGGGGGGWHGGGDHRR